MTKDEAPASPKDAALRLALETLEDIFGKNKVDVPAITAIKQALEHPEPEDYPTYDGYIKKALEQLNPPCKTGSQCTSKCEKCAEPEPVACGYDNYSRDGVNDEISVYLPVETKLYTYPPKRTWQGLTDDDIAEAWAKSKGDIFMRLKPFARAIEAKLKEKNT